jgi:hypothetical protein
MMEARLEALFKTTEEYTIIDRWDLFYSVYTSLSMVLQEYFVQIDANRVRTGP